MTTITPSDQSTAAEILLQRRDARRNFRQWCHMAGFRPMLHHELIIDKCQEVAASDVPRYVILLMPPGTAKSTYTSKLFPPWYLGFRPGNSILACSYSKDLAITFGRTGRNYVDTYSNVLGYALSGASRAADEWETSTGGRYFCAGVGAGIAGHRADLGLIDDYLGSQEDADSKPIREKQWGWFVNDFWPRVSGTKEENDGSVIIIANRRHEDDLVGRLLAKEDNESPIPPERWEVIKLPFFAKENDPLGRKEGEVIWPEKFAKKADQINRMASRVRAGLYQQEPRPDDGGFFRLSWLHGYELQDLPKDLRIYAASDHACSEEKDGNSTVLLFGGWDGEKLWILPTCYWEKDETGEVVRAMLRFGERYDPLLWWAEKGHITKSIGPFLRDQMQEQGIYIRLEEVVPSRAKDVRARAAQGMCEFGQVMFPKFAKWWDKAENELLTFPGGRSDDFVDAFAHLCRGVFRMVKPDKGMVETPETAHRLFAPLTLGSLKKTVKDRNRLLAYARSDR